MPTFPLYNYHYFQTLLQEMERTGTYMIVDGNETLWHIDDIPDMLAQFEPQSVVENN